MRLSRDICLGGRFNNKDILGIKYNGHIIYEYKYDTESSRNVYTISISDIEEYVTVTYGKECLYNLGMETDWGDGTVDFREYHYYSQPGTYVISSTGFFNSGEYVISVDKLRSDIIDGSDLLRSYSHITNNNLILPNTSLMNNMECMFSYCDGLTKLDLNNFVTHNVINMGNMFECCENLTELNLNSFVTHNVTDMGFMFFGCNSIVRLDLSKFDTNKVTDMAMMFFSCNNLEELNLSNFNISNETNITSMFFDNIKLCTLRLDNCNHDTISKIIDKSSVLPTGLVNGETRKIYCKREEAAGLTEPNGWEFIYMDTLVSYDEPQEKLLAPDYTIAEVVDEQLVINQGFAVYDADNENININ